MLTFCPPLKNAVAFLILQELMDGGLIFCSFFQFSGGRGPAICQKEESQEGGEESLCVGEGFCKMQGSLLLSLECGTWCLEDCAAEQDGIFSETNLTGRLKRYSPKMRGRIIATEHLMKSKNQVTEGRTNFTLFRMNLEEGFPWTKGCHLTEAALFTILNSN